MKRGARCADASDGALSRFWERGDERGMNDKERRFCEEYMIDMNARAAAARAGYAHSTALSASGWLRAQSDRYKPEMAGYIRELEAERSRRTGVSADRVLQEYARIAFANIADLGELIELRDDARYDDAAAVAGVKIKKTSSGTDCEIRLYDKMKALEMLGKHAGLFGGDADAPEGSLPRIVVREDGSAVIDEGGA